MKITLNESQTCTLEFTHIRTKNPAKLWVACNPLTGDWIQEHSIDGEGRSAYAADKHAALALINGIVTKSQQNNLPCKVVIGINTMWK